MKLPRRNFLHLAADAAALPAVTALSDGDGVDGPATVRDVDAPRAPRLLLPFLYPKLSLLEPSPFERRVGAILLIAREEPTRDCTSEYCLAVLRQPRCLPQ
jgi:hypothetical protein